MTKGILNNDNTSDETFALIRKINNINIPLLQHSTKFIDINYAERKVDNEAVAMLSDLRDKKVIKP